MSIKSLLFVHDGSGHAAAALDSALGLARSYRATLRILHIAAPPVLPYVLAVPEYAYALSSDQSVLDSLESDARRMADGTIAQANAACRRQMVPLRDGFADMVPGQAQAIYRTVVGELAACLPLEAFTADLIISAHENHPAGDLKVVLTSLFEAGRPILLFPRDTTVVFPSSGHAKTVVLAWDGSRASARALREAVPHMLHAENVLILRILSGGDKADEVSEGDLLTYLRSHCVDAEFVIEERGGASVGQTIVNKALKLQAELLIMGAYGHGHVREMLLGGTTDFVIKNGGIPLLLVR
jgi:nucleotide-binding universal stress UspA family protein